MPPCPPSIAPPPVLAFLSVPVCVNTQGQTITSTYGDRSENFVPSRSAFQGHARSSELIGYQDCWWGYAYVEINGDFGRNSQYFPIPVHLMPTLGSLWNFAKAVHLLRIKMMPFRGGGKVWMCAAHIQTLVCIHLDITNVTDRRTTDRNTLRLISKKIFNDIGRPT